MLYLLIFILPLTQFSFILGIQFNSRCLRVLTFKISLDVILRGSCTMVDNVTIKEPLYPMLLSRNHCTQCYEGTIIASVVISNQV